MTNGRKLLDNVLYRESLSRIACLQLPWTLLQGKKILVAGSTGLIGSFLIDVLMFVQKEFGINFTVFAMGRNIDVLKQRFDIYMQDEHFKYFAQDITKCCPAAVENIAIDYIFQLASNTHPVAYSTEPINTIMTSILGTNNLLDFAIRHQTQRFVFASSVEIYGENRGDTEKFSEEYSGYINCNTLRACYPEGKRAGEALCQAYYSEKKIDIVIPRFCRIYGETMQMSDTKALSQFIKNAVSKENIVLKSDGNQFYSYLHVSDAVSALLYIFFFGKKGEAYNISDEESDITLKDLAKMLARLTETEVIYDIPSLTEKKGYSTATKALLDSSKLKELGWKAMYDIQTGIEQTLRILEFLK